MPSALIVTAAGINCDVELARAFALAGAHVESIHINRLIAEPDLIERFDLIGLPGGFSFGDAVAAGRIVAQLIRQHLYEAFVAAIQRGVPIIAPCNGFQIAVQSGLLPGPDENELWPERPPAPTVALAENASGRFADRWTRVEFPASRSIWTAGLEGSKETCLLPSAHGEGRFVADDAMLKKLERAGRIAVLYGEGENFNGSAASVAGICDASGVVLGLMPHPERYTRWTQHPFWTRLDEDALEGEPIGLQIFRNAIAYARARRSNEAIAPVRMV